MSTVYENYTSSKIVVVVLGCNG